MKIDPGGRRLCEYPYCKNYAESKGIRRGERRYRPFCEKHRYVKIRAKKYAAQPALKPEPKSKLKPRLKPKLKPKAAPKLKLKSKLKSKSKRKS